MVDRAANGGSTAPGRWQTAPEEEAIFGGVAEEVGRVLGAEATAVRRFLGDERAVIVGVWREGGTRGMPVNAELTSIAGTARWGRCGAPARPRAPTAMQTGAASCRQ